MYSLNMKRCADLSCFKSVSVRACRAYFYMALHMAITGGGDADDGSSREIDEKELRAYETRDGKRETEACDIEFRY